MKNKEIVKKLKDSLDYEFDLSFNDRKELLSHIKQLENNRDKAIEICDFYNKKYQKDPLGNQKVLFVINNVMNLLKGDSE